MNKILPLALLLILGVISCNSNGGKKSADSSSIVEETYSTPIDSVYTQCQDLKGLGVFEIDKTTWREVMSNKQMKIDKAFRKTDWDSGYWKCADFLSGKWFEQHTGRIKQFINNDYGFTMQGYTIGDIKFQELDFAFLDDVLVAIYFEFPSELNEKCLNHYIEKFGKGNGSYYLSPVVNLNGTKFEKKHIEWANERVQMEYDLDIYYRMVEGTINRDSFHHNEGYLVYSTERYDEYEGLLKELKEQYKTDALKKELSDLNNL